MQKRKLGQTDLFIAPIVFGGNVFGWTVDEKQSFKILDSLYERGFNTIDTADFYSIWAPGNHGGESETIIGNWLKQNPSKREDIVLFTKVGLDMGIPGHQGLSEQWIMQAVEDSLSRLKTDYIDLYFAHWPDENTPHEETLSAFSKLKDQGKIRAYGTSNFSADQLEASIQAAQKIGVQHYQVLQPEYNLYDRDVFEQTLQPICERHQIGVVSFYSLASGFLSGKYSSLDNIQGRQRADTLVKYFDERGLNLLDKLREVASRHNAAPAEVALAWLLAQKHISAPIASATNLEQITQFSNAVNLQLSPEDMQILSVM
ncbi:aldo/keto reductase [Acinetobacter sp. YH12239]|uniref:aldo/keto reductase n=1 Tax=Acinetobacter sp. YH12239 TaxID=2601166 RepID=UPI0015D3332E|nr:aldo/keto reductase [Acinetobacter sp. YH12239]